VRSPILNRSPGNRLLQIQCYHRDGPNQFIEWLPAYRQHYHAEVHDEASRLQINLPLDYEAGVHVRNRSARKLLARFGRVAKSLLARMILES